MSGNTAIKYCAGCWLWLFFLLPLSACNAPDPTLKPASSADQPPGRSHTAIAQVDGVRAVVESSSWPADPSVEAKLTPLHVRIENNSGAPILLLYRKFALVGPEGQYYSALPPVAAHVDIADAGTDSSPDPPVSNLSFHHQGFFVVPYYGYAYGNLPVWRHQLHHDDAYNKTFHTTYKQLDIPAAELKAWALPEGVIANGGSLSGYLYFEHVDSALNHVELRGDIVHAETGQTLGTLAIPFTIQRQ